MELTIVSTVCIIGGAHEYFSSDEFDNVNVDSTFFFNSMQNEDMCRARGLCGLHE